MSNELTGSCLSTFVRLCAPLLSLFVDDGRSANSSTRLSGPGADPARLIGWR